MDKVFREGDLTPIRYKEFNKFIKGKGFKGRNNYKLADLKAMFGCKKIYDHWISSNDIFQWNGTKEIRFYVEGFNFYRETICYPSIC